MPSKSGLPPTPSPSTPLWKRLALALGFMAALPLGVGLGRLIFSRWTPVQPQNTTPNVETVATPPEAATTPSSTKQPALTEVAPIGATSKVASAPGTSEKLSLPAPAVAMSGAPTIVSNALQKGCFEITFKHKKISSHSDGEACLKHPNLITLQHPKLAPFTSGTHPSSVCIEVNGESVRHQTVAGHPDQIMIGPYAGPNATITARACLTKTCHTKCAAQHDDFMDALGMQDAKGEAVAVRWDGSQGENKEELELNKQVKDVRHLVDGESQESGKKQIFSSWIVDQFHDLGCSQGGGYESKHVEITHRK